MSAGSHDKDTFIAYSIAQLLFPDKATPSEEKQTTPNSAPGGQTAYFETVVTQYQYRRLLVSLRQCLDIPEVLGTLAHLQHFICFGPLQHRPQESRKPNKQYADP